MHNLYNKAMPRAAAFASATQYVGGGRLCPPQRRSTVGRSMRAQCEALGFSASATRTRLARAYAAHKAGAPLPWASA